MCHQTNETRFFSYFDNALTTFLTKIASFRLFRVTHILTFQSYFQKLNFCESKLCPSHLSKSVNPKYLVTRNELFYNVKASHKVEKVINFIGVFHVLHVNWYVNIFLLHKKIFYVAKYVNRYFNMEHMKNAIE